MADYFTPTVIDPIIPNADMTPLETLILSHIFESEPDGDATYFFSEQGPSDRIYVTRAELVAAIAASESIESTANNLIKEKLMEFPADASDLDIDLSGTSWEFFLQDVVKRSKNLRYVTGVSAFTCSKMRMDGFGGMAVVITANSIKGKSTRDIIEDFLAEDGLES
jgi:hypothetical protein